MPEREWNEIGSKRWKLLILVPRATWLHRLRGPGGSGDENGNYYVPLDMRKFRKFKPEILFEWNASFQFPLFLSSRPRYHAEFWYSESSLLAVSLNEVMVKLSIGNLFTSSSWYCTVYSMTNLRISVLVMEQSRFHSIVGEQLQTLQATEDQIFTCNHRLTILLL